MQQLLFIVGSILLGMLAGSGLVLLVQQIAIRDLKSSIIELLEELRSTDRPKPAVEHSDATSQARGTTAATANWVQDEEPKSARYEPKLTQQILAFRKEVEQHIGDLRKEVGNLTSQLSDQKQLCLRTQDTSRAQFEPRFRPTSPSEDKEREWETKVLLEKVLTALTELRNQLQYTRAIQSLPLLDARLTQQQPAEPQEGSGGPPGIYQTTNPNPHPVQVVRPETGAAYDPGNQSHQAEPKHLPHEQPQSHTELEDPSPHRPSDPGAGGDRPSNVPQEWGPPSGLEAVLAHVADVWNEQIDSNQGRPFKAGAFCDALRGRGVHAEVSPTRFDDVSDDRYKMLRVDGWPNHILILPDSSQSYADILKLFHSSADSRQDYIRRLVVPAVRHLDTMRTSKGQVA